MYILAASEITATEESYHAEGVKTWVVLIAHAKAAKPRRESG